MKKYALIGRNLEIRQSRKIHTLIGNYDYNLIEIEEAAELEQYLKDEKYDGFNITDPYKTEALKYMDVLSPDAERIGAVNTVRRLPDGRLRGCNTDIDGFKYTVKGLARDRKCMILGTGGAALACAVALEDLGAAEVILVSRDPEAAREKLNHRIEVVGYNRLYLHYDAQVLINATPVGQFPDLEQSPLAEQRITVRMFAGLELAVDLIYNPYRTKFLQDARRLTKCKTKSGLEMLVAQAIESKYEWLGERTDRDEEDRLVRSVKRKILETQLNVVAIGMPGSGKTTIFRRYAYELGLEFIDTDGETEKIMGETAQAVLGSGEAGIEFFRAMEHIAVREACKHNGAVIATGGGTILNPINRDLLRSNGIVVYVKRPLDKLDIKGRPISINIGVAELFGDRDRIYHKTSDMSILNSRIFGGKRKATGEGNTYNYELKGFVYYIARKIERYLNEIADNQWT